MKDYYHNPYFSPPALQYVSRLNPGRDVFASIAVGDRVTIVTPHGNRLTGRVVMPSGDGRGWVLNLGGPHGTPGLAYPENTVKVSKRRRRNAAHDGYASEYSFSEPEPNPERETWHPGGGMSYRGEYWPGSGRYHHHRRPPHEFDYGAGRWYQGSWYPGGGHYEANNPVLSPYDVSGPQAFTLGNPSLEDQDWSVAGVERSRREAGLGAGGGYGYDYDYELNPSRRPMPGEWHPSFETEEEREADARRRASMESIYDYELNPGCVERDEGLDCWYTNPEPQVEANPTEYPSELARRTCERISRGRGTRQAIWGDVDAVLRHGENPVPALGLAGPASDTMNVRGRPVPVTHSQGGRYHHVRVGHPDDYTAIRTKTLSDTKGIKARVGRFLGRGPRGGKTEVQSYMFDAEVYTPDDVVRWIEGHRTPPVLLMDLAPVRATRRRMRLYMPVAEAKKPTRRKVKRKVVARKKREAAISAGKKKPARSMPPAEKRCVVVLELSGKQCSGWRMKSGDKCSLHYHGIVRRPTGKPGKQAGGKGKKVG